MITGFNHNIKYKARIYHVQTEDSGIKNPHIITHLFVGGNIVATKKADYRHLLVETDPLKLETAIKDMMEDQHKQMLRSLIHGKFDTAINLDNVHHLEGPAPLNVDPDVLARTGGSGNKSVTPTPAPMAAPVQAARPAPAPPVKPVAAPSPQIVGDDLAAAALAALSGGYGAAAATPPPPAAARPSPAPVEIPSQLAPEVLAARALKEKPLEKPVTSDTIFGEDLISEKSLDEVILSYLSLDGE